MSRNAAGALTHSISGVAAVILALGTFCTTGFFGAKHYVKAQAEERVLRASDEMRRSGVGSFTYGGVEAGLFSSTVKVNDVVFTLGWDNSDTSAVSVINIGQVELKGDIYSDSESVPENVSVALSGIEIPLDYKKVPGPQGKLFASSGIPDVIKGELSINQNYSGRSKDYSVSMSSSVEGFGAYEFSLVLGGVPETFGYEKAQDVSLKRMRMEVSDEGLHEILVKMRAGVEGISEDEARLEMLKDFDGSMAVYGGGKIVSDEVGSELRSFIKDPGGLIIILSPDAPIPFMQLQMGLMNPGALMDQLNISVIANKD